MHDVAKTHANLFRRAWSNVSKAVGPATWLIVVVLVFLVSNCVLVACITVYRTAAFGTPRESQGYEPPPPLLGRHGHKSYDPALYPQVPDVRTFVHNATWYATSAYVDTRPMGAYGGLPIVSIIAAGPLEEVREGSTSWYVRMYVRSTGAVITDLDCQPTVNKPADQNTSKHAGATVFCPLTLTTWPALRKAAPFGEDLGVCMIRALDQFCDVASIVPVGVPPHYPEYLLGPMTTVNISNHHHTSANDKQGAAPDDYDAAKGSIAMCVPAVHGDGYADTLHFFLDYYSRLGVDTVNMYMYSPGSVFARVAEDIADRQDARGGKASDKHMPNLVLLPWCVQLGASYRCRPGASVVPLPGFSDFAGSNHGQIMVHQDCVYRSMGVHRWVLFVDMDEFVVPRPGPLVTLHDVVRSAALASADGRAPAEITFRSAFYETCIPSSSGFATHNSTGQIQSLTSVPLSRRAQLERLQHLPRPWWSPARVSDVFENRRRTKYMCDPLGCDRVAIHYTVSMMCDRNLSRQARPWPPSSCKRYVVSEHNAIIHHVRVKSRQDRAVATTSSPPRPCSFIDGVLDLDWTMTNFAVDRLGMKMTSGGGGGGGGDESGYRWIRHGI